MLSSRGDFIRSCISSEQFSIFGMSSTVAPLNLTGLCKFKVNFVGRDVSAKETRYFSSG